MKKLYTVACAVVALWTMTNVGQAGLWSALKDKVGVGENPEEQAAAQQQVAQAQQAEATPAPAEKKSTGKAGKTVQGKSRVQMVEGTPPPVATPRTAADKETIRKGAQKLSAEVNVEKVPSDLFRRYQGKWKGDFWVYSPSGKKEQSQAASIEYTMNGDGTMKMESFYFDRLSKTWVTAETATYVNEGNSVRITIRRPNNAVAKQTGYFNDGQLFLVADITDGVEHYRERIDGKRLLIDGFGVYTGPKSDSHVFIGRFLREQ